MLYPFSRLFSPARSPASGGPAARKTKGFNLIEAAIVLGVVGLVIGGIWVAAAAVSERNKLNSYVTDVATIVQKVRETGPAHYWTGGAAVSLSLSNQLLAMGIAPDNWETPSGFLRDPYYGYTLWVEVNNTALSARVRFQVEIANSLGVGTIPLATCRAITTALYAAFKNTEPTRSTSPCYSNIIMVTTTLGSTAVRVLTPAAPSFVSNNPCAEVSGDIFLIDFYPLY